MSARAAARLEDFGFLHVYEYAAGKSDWFAAGLSREGEQAAVPWIGDFLEEVATSAPEHTIADLRARPEVVRANLCVIVNSEGIVLGLVRDAIREATASTPLREAMHPGPKTYRADYTLDDPVEWMQKSALESTLVTTPEGRLLGLVRLERLHRARDGWNGAQAAAVQVQGGGRA